MKFFKKTLSSLLAGGLLLSALPFGASAATIDDSILENWDISSAKFSSRTALLITESGENGEKVPKTVGFEYSVNSKKGITVTTPTYEEFPGAYETSVLTSEYKTPLDGLSVEITPDNFDFTVDNNGVGNHISLIWSEETLEQINEDYSSYEFATNGLRKLIKTNEEAEDFTYETKAEDVEASKCNGKALCIDITNRNTDAANILTASDVRISYYDGYYVDSSMYPGWSWTFTERVNEDGTGHSFEEIDITEGLIIKIRNDEALGYIVNINGKDYCGTENVAYFNGTESDIDLSGLEGLMGYLTVGAVGSSENSDYTLSRINSYNAGEWKGEPSLPLLDNWTVNAVKFSGRTYMPIAPNGIIKTVGFKADENNGSISVVTPDYDSFEGVVATSILTSKSTTALDGLNVYIKPDDFNFNMNQSGVSNHISLLWSESRPDPENEYNKHGSGLATQGFRTLIDYASGTKALAIDITNDNINAENNMTASSVRITYYDGSYISDIDNYLGYRWAFTQRNDGITREYESIDITKGLRVNVRADDEYGFIVNINGKDYCDENDVAYYDENIGAKVDLSGLCDAGEGYLTVGAVGSETQSVESPCNYSIVSINGYAAADWQGEEAPYSLLENWDAVAAKFSRFTGEIIKNKDGSIKNVGYKFNEAYDNEVLVKVPDYDTFAGASATTLLTSKNKTALDGLKVVIKPEDFDFALDAYGYSNQLSLVWSENGVMDISEIEDITKLYYGGLRGLIDPLGGKALGINITNANENADGKLSASDVYIIYYDGSYISEWDGLPGYRWIFTERTDDILQNFEEIDITNGLEISVRRDAKLGYIVNVNGKDYCNTEDVAYFENGINTEKRDIDLSGLAEVTEGYLTIGSVANKDTDHGLNYRVAEINEVKAADWQGENRVPDVSVEGVTLTVKNLYNVRDYFIARGVYTTYSEVKANRVVNITAAKLGDKTEYSYLLPKTGEHTVYVRFNDGSFKILYANVEVNEPTFKQNGLQLVLGNLEGVKVVRTAYGEYNKVSDIKRAEGSRAFTAKYIKDTSAYTVQYREAGVVTVAVCYENGYTVIEHFEIAKMTPEFAQSDNTVTFSNLNGLKVLRYAKGEYTTSAEIKHAAGCKTIIPSMVKDDSVTVTLTEGTYTFCVQYIDESYNYYTVTVE